MWFGSVDALFRLVVVGGLSYVAIVILLRVSGARTLAKLNAFDFVVTISLGSVLASAFVTSNLPLSTALGAMGVLIGLQWVVAFTASRAQHLRRSLTASPVLVARSGQLQTKQLKKARLTEDEVFQAIRNSGSGGLSSVAAAILETDGTISIVSNDQVGDGAALRDVPGWDHTEA